MPSPFGRRRTDFDPAVLRSIDARWAQTVRERNALLAALKSLACEVSAMLGTIEPEMRAAAGHTNVNVLTYHWEQAKAAIAICEGSK